jgi:putative thiamine transport system substrate-binding protein
LENLSKPFWAFLDALHPHLWRTGKTFPLSVQAMNQMLLDGELLISMSFNPLESDALILKKEIPKTAVSTTFASGGIGNVHFLSIPFNSKNKQAAIKWINHLVSIEAQQAKSDIQIWGDPTILDLEKMRPEDRKLFPKVTLKGPLMSEPHACWMEYLKDEWIKRYGTGS